MWNKIGKKTKTHVPVVQLLQGETHALVLQLFELPKYIKKHVARISGLFPFPVYAILLLVINCFV